MLTRLRFPWQRAIALLIALATVAPVSFAWLPLLSDDGETCGMSCCRRMKSCCCRRAKRHAPESAAAQWQAAKGCAEGCRQRATLPPIVTGPAAAARLAIRPLCVRPDVLAECRVKRAAMRAEHALFGRPPPLFS